MLIEHPRPLEFPAGQHEVHTTTDRDRWPVLLDLGKNPITNSGRNLVVKVDAVAAFTYDDPTDPQHERPLPYIKFEATYTGVTPNEELEAGVIDQDEDEINAMLTRYLADDQHPNGTLDQELASYHRYWQSLGGLTALHISGGEVLTSSGETIRTRLMSNVSLFPFAMKSPNGSIVPRLEVNIFTPVLESPSPEHTRDDV